MSLQICFSCKWPICNSGACWQPGEAIDEIRYKGDPLWEMSIEEIEAFAATQICPCHFRLRVGGLFITLLSLRLMRTESELDSHTPFAKQLLFIWSFMGLVHVGHWNTWHNFYSTQMRIILHICIVVKRWPPLQRVMHTELGPSIIEAVLKLLDSRGRSWNGRSHLIFSCTWFLSLSDTFFYSLFPAHSRHASQSHKTSNLV